MSGLYRNTNVTQVSSPEQMNEYIHIATPGNLILLFAVVILLIGGIVWSFFGKIEMTVPASVLCEDGVCYIYTSADNSEAPDTTMKIRVSGNDYDISKANQKPILLENEDEYFFYKIGLKKGSFYYISEAKASKLNDGIYDAYIITESKRPIDFLIR